MTLNAVALLRYMFIAFGIAVAPAIVNAQSCSWSVPNVNFGSVDTLSVSTTDTTATINITCGPGLGRVLLCPNIGSGSGGATASSRQMADGRNTLNYQLYSDNYTTVWGSSSWPFPPRPPAFTLDLSPTRNTSINPTLHARVFGSQSVAPAGSYLSKFGGDDARLLYQTCVFDSCPPCNNSLSNRDKTKFTVNATILSNCRVSAQNIDFGTTAALSSNIDSLGRVTVTCTPGTPYNVGLSSGLHSMNVAARRMQGLGGATVTYSLYRNAAHTQVWGVIIGMNTVPGSGTGLSQNLAVYGRVPPQTTPSAGVYSDTVVVTVTY